VFRASATWEFANPAGRGADAVREIREDIDHRVGVLLVELALRG
jgi:arsenate reductase (thioredoxin)